MSVYDARKKTYDTPVGYPPLSYCVTCGNDFSGDDLFARHRVGKYEYDFSPQHLDGRRCLTRDEMREKGWCPYTEQQLRASRKNKRRAGYGIEVWFDPAKVAQVRRGAFLRK